MCELVYVDKIEVIFHNDTCTGDENKDSENEDEEKEQELDKEMGELGEQESEKLDEQMWGSDDEEDKEDNVRQNESKNSYLCSVLILW